MKIREPQFQAATPACIYLLKVNNRNTRTRCEICLKWTYFWTYFTPFSSVSIVNFEHVIVGWVLFLEKARTKKEASCICNDYIELKNRKNVFQEKQRHIRNLVKHLE